jgi:cell fate (sporulation/competence/biofilm development) regulator YlbF (YheA/YmcA/DUF963 family)
MLPINISEDAGISAYLEKRGLISQYKKAKQNILSHENTKVYFKERKPTGSGIWYFRINRKYRALARYDGDDLVVFMIDDHQ